MIMSLKVFTLFVRSYDAIDTLSVIFYVLLRLSSIRMKFDIFMQP